MNTPCTWINPKWIKDLDVKGKKENLKFTIKKKVNYLFLTSQYGRHSAFKIQRHQKKKKILTTMEKNGKKRKFLCSEEQKCLKQS